MSGLKTCVNCGRYFGVNANEELCSTCSQAKSTKLDHITDPEEQKFVYARNIVYDFPDISPMDLVKKMTEDGVNITILEVMNYVKAGRLILKGVGSGDYCEDCGIKILSGRRCPVCTNKFEEAIQNNANAVNRTLEASKPDLHEKKSGNSRMYSRN